VKPSPAQVRQTANPKNRSPLTKLPLARPSKADQPLRSSEDSPLAALLQGLISSQRQACPGKLAGLRPKASSLGVLVGAGSQGFSSPKTMPSQGPRTFARALAPPRAPHPALNQAHQGHPARHGEARLGRSGCQPRSGLR